MALDTVGLRLTFALKQKGWTQAELARQARVSPGEVTRICKDERETPGAQPVMRMCDALGLVPKWLMDGTGPMWSEPPLGRVALAAVLKTMEWPEPVNMQAADAAIFRAQQEAETTARERPESLWGPRLRELYREASRTPAAADVDSGLTGGHGEAPPVATPKRAPKRR